ncbi:unnamed protein product [Jaminaea pallidilutea]
MRSTPALQGIKGIFPLLKKECPSAFHHPTLSALAGYRLAIDATLLVSRFHFSASSGGSSGADSHPARHLIGFHRLISSLRAADIYPIFVFDHLTERVRAKSRENDKRRERRRTLSGRLKIEGRRAWRLRMLRSWLTRLAEMQKDEVDAVSHGLRNWKAGQPHDQDADESRSSIDPARFSQHLDQLIAANEASSGSSDAQLWSQVRESAEAQSEEGLFSLPEREAEQIEEWATASAAASGSSFAENSRETPALDWWFAIYEAQTSPAQAMIVAVDFLYQDFRRTEQSSYTRFPATPAQSRMDEVESHLYRALAEGSLAAKELGSEHDATWRMVEQRMNESMQEVTTTINPAQAQQAPPPESTSEEQLGPWPAQMDSPTTQQPDRGLQSDSQDRSAAEPLPVSRPTQVPPTNVPSVDTSVQDAESAGLLQEAEQNRRAQVASVESKDETDNSKHFAPVTDTQNVQPDHLPANTIAPTPAADNRLTAPSQTSGSAEALEAITAQSRHLQRSYARTAAPLSTAIFDDCATLCSLLQAPVLWTGSGAPYGGARGEAEALAASLVAAGQADAVATEDSDVLLAEVPLLRHLTGVKKGMELVDTQEARRSLFPPKVQSARPSNVRKRGPLSAASVEDSFSTGEQSGVDSATGSSELQLATETEEQRRMALSRAEKLSRYTMLEMALLCGTDYNRTIPGLASRGALRLLREHGGTIRGILRGTGVIGERDLSGTVSSEKITSTAPAQPKYSPPDGLSWKEYGMELSRARSVFKNPPDARRALSLAGVKPWDDEKVDMDEEADEEASGLRIPKPAGVPLLDHIRASTGGSREPQDHQVDANSAQYDFMFEDGAIISDFGRPSRRFSVPDYDREAVSAFLHEKGVFSSQKAASSSPSSSQRFEPLGVDSSTSSDLQQPNGLDGDAADSSSLDTSVVSSAPVAQKGNGNASTRRRRSASSRSGQSDSASMKGSLGFGQPLGGEVAARRFSWDV